MSPLRAPRNVSARAWLAVSFGHGAFLAGAALAARETGAPPEILVAGALAAFAPPFALPAAASLVVSHGRRRTFRLLTVAVLLAGLSAALVPSPPIAVLLLGIAAAAAFLAAFPHALLLSDVVRARSAGGGMAASGLGVAAFAAGALGACLAVPAAPADIVLLVLPGLLSLTSLPFLFGAGPRPPGPPQSISLHFMRALATARLLRLVAAAAALTVGPGVAVWLLLGTHVAQIGDARLAVPATEAAFVAGAAGGGIAAAAAARTAGPAAVHALAGAAGAAAVFLLARPSPSLLPLLAAAAGAAAGAAYAAARAAALDLRPEAGGAPLGAAVLAATVPPAVAGAVVLYRAAGALGGPAAGMFALAAALACGVAAALSIRPKD